MSKLSDTMERFLSERERLLVLRREHAMQRAAEEALQTEAAVLRGGARTELLELLEQEPEKFIGYDLSKHGAAARLFGEYVHGQLLIAQHTAAASKIFSEIVKARRAYRKLVEELPPLIHSDMAGILSSGATNDAERGDTALPEDQRRDLGVGQEP